MHVSKNIKVLFLSLYNNSPHDQMKKTEQFRHNDSRHDCNTLYVDKLSIMCIFHLKLQQVKNALQAVLAVSSRVPYRLFG